MSDDRSSDRSATSLVVLGSVLLALSTLTVLLRFYARRWQKVALGPDDWLTLPALISFSGACACLFYLVHIKGLGYSTGDFSAEYVKDILQSSVKSQITLNICSIFCFAATKCSALFFYKRIFCISGRNGIFRTIILVSVVVVACWMVTYAVLIGFQCPGHFSAPWTGEQKKYCTLSYPNNLGSSISDVILDVWVLILPIYPISKLHTAVGRRFAIAGIFLLACVGVGASIARLVLNVKVTKLGVDAVHRVNPEQYQSRSGFYWTLEMGVSVIAVNLPSIWIMLTSVGPDVFLRSMRSVVSLVSMRSGGSHASPGSRDGRSNSEQVAPEIPASCAADGRARSSATAEAYKEASFTEKGMSAVPDGHIRVSRSIEQHMGSPVIDEER